MLAAALVPLLLAQDGPDEIAPERASAPPVAITFTPPDLEGDIVLGIFDGSGKLKRTLRFEAGSPELVIDTNGFIVQWDGRDDAGAPCAAGRYEARGFVVGGQVVVEGRDFHFNDWMAEDHIAAIDARLCEWREGFGVELITQAGRVFRRISPDGMLAEMPPPQFEESAAAPPEMPGWAPGRDGTTWGIFDLHGQHVVLQLGKDNAALRELRVPRGEPQPVEVRASQTEDAILLREVAEDGRQRVRMLRRGGSETTRDGRVTADWEVVFEREMQPFANFGLVEGRLVRQAGNAPQPNSLTIPLVPNALVPGPQKLQLWARGREPGSALEAGDGLPLLEISSQGNWSRFALAGDGREAALYQGDVVVVEEFAISNLDHIAAFDAGSFLLAAPK